jgi:hypothetical protein
LTELGERLEEQGKGGVWPILGRQSERWGRELDEREMERGRIAGERVDWVSRGARGVDRLDGRRGLGSLT